MIIQKISVADEAARLTQPFSPIDLAYVDEFVVRMSICQGEYHWHQHTNQDELFFVQEGQITLETELGNLVLNKGEMAVVPKGVRHRPIARQRAVVLLFEPRALTSRGDR